MMSMISQYFDLITYSVAAGIICNWVIIKTVGWHGKWTADGATGIQKVHQGLVPRIGGLSILLVLTACAILSPYGMTLGLFLLLSLPAFLSGFIEDITKVIRPIYRLFACLFVGLLAWMNDIAIKSVDIWFMDNILAYPIISLLVTMLVVAALANAINMIDGLNGLSGGYVVVASTVLAIIAYFNNEPALSFTAIALASSILGYLVFNWPFGRIFLGDGGAYMLGAILALIAISLAQNNEAVTQTLTLVVLSYPAWEISLSMARRLFGKSSMTEADHNHLHSRIYQYLSALGWRVSSVLINSYASLILVSIMAVTMIVPMVLITGSNGIPGTNLMIIFAQFIIYSLCYRFFGK